MSGGPPPHHPHNRHVPPATSAWNHLPSHKISVPSYFPRQPQAAHMQADHPLLHQPTWHTPTTTEAMKLMPHAQMLNEMFKNESLFPRDCVDLSLTRNGNQNGEPPPTPSAISLSVRDTSKINSLLDLQAMELTKSAGPNLKKAISPGSIGLKATSPGLLVGSGPLMNLTPTRKSLSPAPKSSSPGLNLGLPATISAPDLSKKRSNIRVDSILERLNPTPEKTFPFHEIIKHDQLPTTTSITIVPAEKSHGVIVQAANFDENSNSSGTTVPTPKEEDSASMHSNEDSLDSTKSRRKRKPSKTVRVNKEDDNKAEPYSLNHTPTSDPATIANILEGTPSKVSERIDTSSVDELDGVLPAKARRKTSSESETLDDIAAMVQEGLKAEEQVKADSGLIVKEAETLANNKEAMVDQELKSEPKPLECSNAVDLLPKTLELKNSSSSDKVITLVLNVASALPDGNSMAINDVKDNIEKSEIVTEKQPVDEEARSTESPTTTKPVTVSVIKSKEIFSSPKEVAAPLVTPAQKKASITQILEVENKLEEMFAGIVEEDEPKPTEIDLETGKNDSSLGLTDDSSFIAKELPVPNDSIKPSEESPKQDIKKDEEEDKKTPKKQKIRPSDSESAEVPAKKKRFTKTKGSPKKAVPRKGSVTPNKALNKVSSLDLSSKDISYYDSNSNASSSKSRGPFVQIRGPRDSPLSVSVVNAPLGDEDGERKIIKNKKFHDDSEYRHKVRSKGLHCSTLSTKYDAERKDASWICAFCKRGPHASELTGPTAMSDVPPPGDLFGPYVITTQCPEFEKRLDDPYDRQFKSRKITKVLDAAKSTSISKKTKRKSESSSVDPTDAHLGITATGNNNTFEVWVHEDCMVWGSGIYLVGAKIVGLEEAVWTCSNMSCFGCGLKGANVTCVKRGCLNISHVSCARRASWQLDEENFKAYCPDHLR
ncbi:unnamed protein product [Ceutorhynchus assimilis]|uniref:PHD-type domain-containing protein n=1 Tax=Ceutorhynchus assimilis TaxID=467358 RepID=A0A9N9MPU7_9CUCU|nr:unnamed protein product [Ceutorhynchus assimilis]